MWPLARELPRQPCVSVVARSGARVPFNSDSAFDCVLLVDAGVTIINFIRLSWERDELESQMYGEAADRALRPVWRMTEGFERAYTLQVISQPLAVAHSISWGRRDAERVSPAPDDFLILFRTTKQWHALKYHPLVCAQCKNKGDKWTATDEANFEKMEEINFHKIAMRYSNSLVLS